MTARRQAPARDPSSIFEILRDFQSDGYDADLFAEEGGEIRCGSCDVVTPAAEVEVAELRRLEGASDPADMAAVVAATCPSCGAMGVMVVMYGPEASGADSDVLAALRSAPRPRPATDLPEA